MSSAEESIDGAMDPIISLRLSFTIRLDCWPQLQDVWHGIGHQVNQLLTEIGVKPFPGWDMFLVALNRSVNDVFLKRLVYIAVEQATERRQTETLKDAENMFRRRSESGLHTLMRHLAKCHSCCLEDDLEAVNSAQAVASQLAQLHGELDALINSRISELNARLATTAPRD